MVSFLLAGIPFSSFAMRRVMPELLTQGIVRVGKVSGD
jgi:hypothetical protein